MNERIGNQETGQISESEGLPADLYTNPEKYDADIPFWKRTVDLVNQYSRARINKRNALLDQFAVPAVRDSERIKFLIDNLNLVSQVIPAINTDEIKSCLIARAEAAAAHTVSLSNWTPKRIEELVRIGLDSSGELREATEKIKSAIFNAPKAPSEAVSLQYNAAWAMISTTDNKIREELFSILCFEKSWFTADSIGNFYFTLGSTVPDDTTCEKYHAVVEALKPVGFLLETKGEVVPISPKRLQRRDLLLIETQSLLSETEMRARGNILLRYINQNPKRYAKYKAYVESRVPDILSGLLQPASPFQVTEGVDFTKKSQELREVRIKAENYSWPENIIYSTKEPLTVLVRETFIPKVYRTFWESYQRVAQEKGFKKLTNIPIQLTDDVELDIIAKAPLTIEQKQEIIREIHSAVLSKDPQVVSVSALQSFAGIIDVARAYTSVVGPYDKAENVFFNVSRRLPEEEIGRLSSIIEYHRPMFTVEQINVIENQISLLREDLQKGFTRSVGRRGYTLIVSDPSLKQLGYEEITVNQPLSSNKIGVKMMIDGETYTFNLDGDYRIILGQDLKQIKNSQDKAWLEVFILSHLRKLICTGNEEEELKAEMIGGARQYESYRKQTVSRVEHLRRQAPGRSYSTDAFNRCLKSRLPVRNLYLINQMRTQIGKGGTKETGIWTYVSGSDYVDSPEANPVKIAFKNASEDIRKVINLGAVSEEEIARLEDEIFRELSI